MDLIDGSSAARLLGDLSEPHLFQAIMYGLSLLFFWQLWRSWLDRKGLHKEIEELNGRLEQCEHLWALYGVRLAVEYGESEHDLKT